MNKTKIEWCDYTWNPVVGCERGCEYCYARRMNNRFKWIPKFSDLGFFVYRLIEPSKVKKPSRIFVGSMSDVCYWPPEWLELVLDVCKNNPQHTFMFLTKGPSMLNDYDFLPHDNVIVGLTITGTESYADACKKYADMVEFKRRFLSIEPLLGVVRALPFAKYEHVIVGAMTGPGAVKPKKEWIESIKHPNIFYKDNIKKYL